MRFQWESDRVANAVLLSIFESRWWFWLKWLISTEGQHFTGACPKWWNWWFGAHIRCGPSWEKKKNRRKWVDDTKERRSNIWSRCRCSLDTWILVNQWSRMIIESVMMDVFYERWFWYFRGKVIYQIYRWEPNESENSHVSIYLLLMSSNRNELA